MDSIGHMLTQSNFPLHDSGRVGGGGVIMSLACCYDSMVHGGISSRSPSMSWQTCYSYPNPFVLMGALFTLPQIWRDSALIPEHPMTHKLQNNFHNIIQKYKGAFRQTCPCSWEVTWNELETHLSEAACSVGPLAGWLARCNWHFHSLYCHSPVYFYKFVHSMRKKMYIMMTYEHWGIRAGLPIRQILREHGLQGAPSNQEKNSPSVELYWN